ncbi:MAG: hypothetical protein GY793_11585 [Proteobacteria bacterium]|nr:hypothetical protein [Pseudomonadota bacterium]
MENIRNKVLDSLAATRMKTKEHAKFIIVDVETFEELRATTEFEPSYKTGVGDLFMGLVVAIVSTTNKKILEIK